MERPPRDPSAPLFTRMLVSSALTQGTVVLVVTMAIHTWSSLVGTTEHARAMSFGTLVLGILGIILNNRSFSEPIYRSLTRPNRLMVGTMIGVPLTLIATVTIPQIAALFRFATLDAASLGLMAAAGLSSWVLLELVERAASRVQATLVRAA